jgi:hypothetical protein
MSNGARTKPLEPRKAWHILRRPARFPGTQTRRGHLASRLARLGKLLGWASLVWLGLIGGAFALGVLLAGGGRLPPDLWEMMLGLWGFVAAPVLVFGMSAPTLRERPRAWSTVLSLIRLNLAVAVAVGGAYAALLASTTSSPTRFKDALIIYGATTVVAIVAVSATMTRNRPANSDASRQ